MYSLAGMHLKLYWERALVLQQRHLVDHHASQLDHCRAGIHPLLNVPQDLDCVLPTCFQKQ